MDLDLTDDQRQLADLVDRLVAATYGFERRDRVSGGGERWAQLADLGLLMPPFSEADGGVGGGGVEAMIVGEAFGRGLVAEPYLASAVFASAALAACGGSKARTDLIAALVAGERIACLADAAEAVMTDGRLSGRAALVLGGDAADRLMVAAAGPDGAILALVDVAAPGVSRAAYRLHGGYGAADFVLDGAPVSAVLAGTNSATAVLVRAREAAVAYLVAEALGAAQAAFELTVEHLKTRVQFGRLLGSNQALQHRAAEMFVELEQLRSAALYAASLCDAADADDRARAVSAAKLVAGRAGRFIGQQAVQLHGGVGVTEEYAVGAYFKRLTAIGLLFGDADTHAAALAARGGFVGAQPYWEGDGRLHDRHGAGTPC